MRMEKEEYYCPDGYIFLTNIDIGENESIHSFLSRKYETCTEFYQRFILKLRSAGYLVQVAEPFDMYDQPIDHPLRRVVAIYVKKEMGETIKIEAWKALDEVIGK